MNIILPKRILIVQIGKIGDMVLTTPLFSLLKKQFRLSQITVLASQINKDILTANPYIDDVIVYEKNPGFLFSFVRGYFKKFDLWIDTKFEYSRTSEMLLKMIKPAFSLGYNSRKKIFDIDLNNYLEGEHAININTAPIRYFNENAELNKLRPEIYYEETTRRNRLPIVSSEEKKKILLNISAGHESRYLDVKVWNEVINEIADNFNFDILIMGKEKDLNTIEELKKKPDKIKFIHTPDIFSVLELIRECDYIITPDTSIVHIASAYNKPQLVFYPKVEWNFKRFAPVSDRFEVVFSKFENKMEIDEEEMKLKLNKLICGNAGSRTRVQKEDH